MQRKKGFYEKYVKRALDILCAILALLFFGWFYIILIIIAKIKIGSPIIFKQPRPGTDEKIFNLYKFRTMTNEKDKDGKLLPDEKRLVGFGNFLRRYSLDELPEVINILKGDMSVVGPRPQLVRDMVFMTPEQRRRHTARPGLSGLAQVSGRNAISWEQKFDYDLQYIENISFKNDLKIIFRTLKCVFVTQEGITQKNKATSDDFGDYLLEKGAVSKEEYDARQLEAKKLLEEAHLN